MFIGFLRIGIIKFMQALRVYANAQNTLNIFLSSFLFFLQIVQNLINFFFGKSFKLIAKCIVCGGIVILFFAVCLNIYHPCDPCSISERVKFRPKSPVSAKGSWFSIAPQYKSRFKSLLIFNHGNNKSKYKDNLLILQKILITEKNKKLF